MWGGRSPGLFLKALIYQILIIIANGLGEYRGLSRDLSEPGERIRGRAKRLCSSLGGRIGIRKAGGYKGMEMLLFPPHQRIGLAPAPHMRIYFSHDSRDPLIPQYP